MEAPGHVRGDHESEAVEAEDREDQAEEDEAAAEAVYELDDQDGGFELCPRDPARMELTDQERQWALAIKEAIESDAELENVSDFEVAQLALVDRDKREQALERVRHFQIFREEYKLRNTVEEGKRISRDFVQQHPLTVLSVCLNPDEVGFAYYSGHIFSPDFTAIRKGINFVLETMDYDWHNLTMKTRRKMWTECLGVYPYHVRKLKYFHMGLFASLAASLMKKFVPQEIYNKVQVGCQFGGRLDTFYVVPTREIANQRLIERIDACLERRYENIQNFGL
ncbi:expressed unknown protein [Seminavis robusta]|uniref:CRAL-TRIO domain-containing protein n=1 Tax=Seminavis robusta TaxID=568900 RepID=A0A9N8E6M5_9STRA|nr:expressed unknown protein [Seminavis robusta]|eukprot:Sro719_g192350.1 n/a (281) ;mRNA; f:30274-31198